MPISYYEVNNEGADKMQLNKLPGITRQDSVGSHTSSVTSEGSTKVLKSLMARSLDLYSDKSFSGRFLSSESKGSGTKKTSRISSGTSLLDAMAQSKLARDHHCFSR